MAVDIEWRTAAPLWPASLQTPNAILRPALLRFSSDQFMDELLALLQSPQPGQLSDYMPSPDNLKLFQPIHGDFNLVAASLVCRTVGLPDRAINASTEKISFVLRRLEGTNEKDRVEYAWINNPSKEEACKGPAWQPQAQPRTLCAGEQLYPLFPITYSDKDRKRRVLAGLIPTSSRDTFVATKALNPLPVDSKFHPLEDQVKVQIVYQIEALQGNSAKPPTDGAADAVLFMLLDLALFLEANLKSAWKTIMDGSLPTGELGSALDMTVDGKTKLSVALKKVYEERARITGEDSTPHDSSKIFARDQTVAVL